MSRQFIRNSVAYYMRTGYSYSEALRHANADLKWWRDILKGVAP